MFTIRQYRPEDYPVLVSWFRKWEWPAWPEDALTPYSYIIEYEGTPIMYSGFYKVIGSAVAKMTITIGDRHASSRAKTKALNELYEHIFERCKAEGVKYLWFSTGPDTKILHKKLVKMGSMNVCEGTAYICVKSINGDNVEFFSE